MKKLDKIMIVWLVVLASLTPYYTEQKLTEQHDEIMYELSIVLDAIDILPKE